jgi:hypothetical protein
MIKTLMDFQSSLDDIVARLRPVRVDGLLNEEGIRTFEACHRLSELAEFHDDFKSYAEDGDVKEVFKQFSDCRKVKSAERFLGKQIAQ